MAVANSSLLRYNCPQQIIVKSLRFVALKSDLSSTKSVTNVLAAKLNKTIDRLNHFSFANYFSDDLYIKNMLLHYLMLQGSFTLQQKSL
jgi:hypothetical protein